MDNKIFFWGRRKRLTAEKFTPICTDDIAEIEREWKICAIANRDELKKIEDGLIAKQDADFCGFTPSKAESEEDEECLYFLTPDFDAHKNSDTSINKGNDYYLNLFKNDPSCFAVVNTKSGGIAPIYLRQANDLKIRQKVPHPSFLYDFKDYVIKAFEINPVTGLFNGDSWYQQRYIFEILYVNENATPMKINVNKLKEALAKSSNLTKKKSKKVAKGTAKAQTVKGKTINDLLMQYVPGQGMSNAVAREIVKRFHFRDIIDVSRQYDFLEMCYGRFHQNLKTEIISWLKTSSKQDDNARRQKFLVEVGTSDDALAQNKPRCCYALKSQRNLKKCDAMTFRYELEHKIDIKNCERKFIIAPMGFGKTESLLRNAKANNAKLVFLVKMVKLKEEIKAKAEALGMTAQIVERDAEDKDVDTLAQVTLMTYDKWRLKGIQTKKINSILKEATLVCDEIQDFLNLIPRIIQNHANVIFLTANRIEKIIPEFLQCDIYEKLAKPKLKMIFNISANNQVPKTPLILNSICYFESRKLCVANSGLYSSEDSIDSETAGCTKTLDDLKNEALRGLPCIFNSAAGAGVSLQNKNRQMEVILSSSACVRRGYEIAQSVGRCRNGLDEIHFYLPSTFKGFNEDLAMQGQHVVRRQMRQSQCNFALASLLGEISQNYDINLAFNYEQSYGQQTHETVLGQYEIKIKKALIEGMQQGLAAWQQLAKKSITYIAEELLNNHDDKYSDKAIVDAIQIAKIAATHDSAKQVVTKLKQLAAIDRAAALELLNVLNAWPHGKKLSYYEAAPDEEIEKDMSVKKFRLKNKYQKALVSDTPNEKFTKVETTLVEMVAELNNVYRNCSQTRSQKYPRFMAYKIRMAYGGEIWSERKPKDKKMIIEQKRVITSKNTSLLKVIAKLNSF